MVGTDTVEIAITPEEFAERRSRAATAARECGFVGLLVCSRGGGTLDRYGDVLYLTNHYSSFPYTPDLAGAWSGRAHGFVVLRSDGELRLITDVPDDGRISCPPEAVVYTDEVLEAVVAGLQDLGMTKGSVGLIGADVLPVSSFRVISEALPGVDWPDAQNILTRLRAIKSPAEIAMLRHASRIGSRTIEAMMAAAKPGATHGNIVAAGMRVLVPAGGQLYNSFMASGRGGNDPVYNRSTFPTWGSTTPLEEGHWLRLGISGVVDGYVFDLSRSCAIGPASNRQIELFETAIDVIEAGISAVRPGATAAEVATAGLACQETRGFNNNGVFKALGHGIGLGWDAPWLSPNDETPLEPGMVLCLERTIRSNDGYLGDFEETVVVTDNGCEVITDAQKRFW
jgi:Xaa-Pro aminopeptidase